MYLDPETESGWIDSSFENEAPFMFPTNANILLQTESYMRESTQASTQEQLVPLDAKRVPKYKQISKNWKGNVTPLGKNQMNVNFM